MSNAEKRIPVRTCIVCRDKRQRDQLLRVVRMPDGQIKFDKTGRLSGRGAHVCKDADRHDLRHGDGSIDRGKLRNALKLDIDESTVKMLGGAMNSYFANQLI